MNATPRAPGKKSSRTTGAGNKILSAEAQRQEAERFPGLLPRLAAAAILRDIVAQGHTLDERFAPEAVPSRLNGLDHRDRALVRSIVTVALRRFGTLRASLAALLERGLPRQATSIEWTLIAAAAQLLFLDVPDHAAVDLAVRALRLETKTAPFAALVNGVLRNMIRRREEFLAPSDPLQIDTPQWLAARWRKTYGDATALAIAEAHRCEPTLDLTVKTHPASWAERLDGIVLPNGSVRLATHRPIHDLEGYEEGAWWVQDAAATLPARLLRPAPGLRVADLCAAPGGKAAQLAAAGAEVTAVDKSAERLKLFTANFARLDLRAEIIVADILTLKAATFDAVLVDAPCSATGTIRRHPDIAWTKKPGDIAALAQIQSRMLDKAIELVKPGGTIVYCTCSLEPEEGEMQIAALLRRNPDVMRAPIDLSEIAGLDGLLNDQGDLRTLPSHLPNSDPRLAGLDGFYASRLVRRG